MNTGRGIVYAFPLAVLLHAAVFGISAFVTGSFSKGGAVTLTVAAICVVVFIALILTDGKASGK